MRGNLLLTLMSVALAGCAAGSEPTTAPMAAATAPPTATGAAPASPTAPALANDPAPSGEVRTYTLVSGESEARFLIDEILAGSPKVVVGVTQDVSGEIRGDLTDPAGVQVGEVRVDMSTLRTDNSFRNRAIHDAILQTGVEANRYALFRTTSIEGLPAQAEVGSTYPLRLTGDLTIHGVTRSVTFEAQITPVSAERLEGLASVTLRYADFEVFVLRLPPQVASVGEEVTLEIEFVAEAS